MTACQATTQKFKELLGEQFVLLQQYINANHKHKIKCLKHNTIFLAVPKNCNYYGYVQGCASCTKERQYQSHLTKSKNAQGRLELLLGNNYKLLNKYHNDRTKIKIKCLEHGEIFTVFPASCLQYKKIMGCKGCESIRRHKPNNNKRKIAVQAKFVKLLGGNFQLVGDYYNSHTKVKIKCLAHDKIFMTLPGLDIRSRRIIGCIDCSKERHKTATISLMTPAKNNFIRIVKCGNHFVLLEKYKGYKNRLKAFCKKHNQHFSISVDATFCQGYVAGCNKCKKTSEPEKQILTFVDKLIGKEKRDHQPMWRHSPGRHGWFVPDIVIPEQKLVIEHNGLYRHSYIAGSEYEDKLKHYKRRQWIEALGYRVIYIWGDDWINRKDAIKRYIKALLCPQSLPVWDARKLQIKSISNLFANKFFDKYHPQGKTSGGHTYIGLYDSILKKTVAIMGFSTTSRPVLGKPNTAELTRYASRGRVRGGASRLLAHYVKTHTDMHTIVSFSDNDYFDGGMYPAIGFKYDGEVKPVYSTIWLKQRKHKSFTRRTNLVRLDKQGKIKFNPVMTEESCLAYNGIRRCWNSGKKRWIYEVK